MPTKNGFYTIKETASQLGIAERTVRQWIRDGKLKANKYSGSKNVWISTDEVERKLKELGK